MAEFFIEILVADDDDANLSNGTPHFDEIVTRSRHGIGTSFYINVQHTALDDQASNALPITAWSSTRDDRIAFGVTLNYSVNGLAYESQPMTPTGNPDEWGGEVPPTSGRSCATTSRHRVVRRRGGGADGRAGEDHHVFIAGPAFPSSSAT